MRLIDLTGRTFGSLVVVGRADDRGAKVRWLVRCPHGTRFVVIGAKLREGSVVSCRRRCGFCPLGHDINIVGRNGTACAACWGPGGIKLRQNYLKTRDRRLESQRAPLARARQNLLAQRRSTERQLAALGVEGYADGS